MSADPPNVVVEAWARDLPEPATSEQVAEDFWFVRLPAEVRSWIPIEIEVGQRTVKLTSRVIIPPDERHADVYRFLLRHNFAASGVAFSIDPQGLVCLVARVPHEDFHRARLDALAGRMVELTDTTFRSILQIGFASRLRKGGG